MAVLQDYPVAYFNGLKRKDNYRFSTVCYPFYYSYSPLLDLSSRLILWRNPVSRPVRVSYSRVTIIQLHPSYTGMNPPWSHHWNETSSAVLLHGTILFYVVLTFEFVDEILWCNHSNEASSVVLSHTPICFVSSSNFRVYGRNPIVRLLK